MNIDAEDEIKKEFQLERLIFFSDAVFAIIITIMVLDVKLPDIAQAGEAASKNAFIQILPKLIAYIISFFAVGSIWMRHLRIFSFLKDYDTPLIALNLLFLFSVSLFPFALSFVFSSTQVMHYTWGVYTYMGIVYFTVFTQTLLVGYLVKHKETLCVKSNEIDNVMRWKVRRLNLFLLPGFIIIAFSSKYLYFGQYVVFGLLVIYIAIIRRVKKKYYPKKSKFSIASAFSSVKKVKQHTKKVNKQID
jgi:uncharacterized membrane protein